jgi:hypothetical protein
MYDCSNYVRGKMKEGYGLRKKDRGGRFEKDKTLNESRGRGNINKWDINRKEREREGGAGGERKRERKKKIRRKRTRYRKEKIERVSRKKRRE